LNRPSPRSPRHPHGSNRSSPQPSREGQHSSELVPYYDNQGWDNDGFSRDNQDDLENYDRWERISADSISL
jgi:hypothetical protein